MRPTRIPVILGLVVLAGAAAGYFIKVRPDRSWRQRADDYFADERYDAARIAYKNVLREDPADGWAFERIGMSWVAQGVPVRAIPFLVEGARLSPEGTAARRELASALLAVGQVEGARKEALLVLDADPGDAEALLTLAGSSRSGEELDEAARWLERRGRPEDVTTHLVAATLAGKRGEVEEAEDHLREALEADPGSVRARLAMAGVHLGRGETEAARRELRLAVGNAPYRSSARLRYAEFLADHGEPGEARAVMGEVTRNAGDYLPAWTFLAKLAAGDDQHAEALRILEKVLRVDSTNFAAQELKAHVLLGQGEVEAATEVVERLDRIYANVPGIKYQLARLYLRGGHPEKARPSLEEALALNPDYVEASLLRAELLLRTGTPLGAIAEIEGLQRRHPRVVAASRRLLASAYASAGQLERAAALYREQVAEDPDEPQAYVDLGVVLRQLGDRDGALRNFELAQERAPDNYLVTLALIELDLERKDFASAHRRVEPRLAGDPHWAAHYLEGQIHAAAGEREEAEGALFRALELNPSAVVVYDLLVESYLAARKPDEAVRQLEAYLETDPRSRRHQTLLAMLHEERGDREAAAGVYEDILGNSPDFVPVLNNLAYLYSADAGRREEAVELAGRARALDPENPAVADTLGWVSYRAGRYPEALVLLEEAGRGLPNSQEVQYHLGMARAKMGMLDPARQALRKALASPEEFAGREEARLRLASLDDAGAESVAELEARIGEQPRDVLLHLRLARRHEAAGALEEAAEAYRAALGINPDHLEALKALARLNLGPRGSGEAALEHARKARTLAPGDAEAAALLGRAALRQGDYPWAYRLLQEALSAFGEDVVVWESLGRASYHVGRISEARRAFERVVELAPEDSLARRFLVLTDPARGEWGSLEGEVEAQLRRDPDDLPALMARGRMRQEGGDREGAMEVFRGILERHPQFPPALVALATLLGADSERLREAYELAVTARELLPGDPGVARALGILSYRRDDAEYAAELLEEWEGAGRLDPEGLYYLGMSYLGTGRRQEGRQALARALEAGLEGALAESAAARLSGD